MIPGRNAFQQLDTEGARNETFADSSLILLVVLDESTTPGLRFIWFFFLFQYWSSDEPELLLIGILIIPSVLL